MQDGGNFGGGYRLGAASAALVLMMTPALAFFYGGMVRKKNVLSTLNLSFIIMALISVQWVLLWLQPGLRRRSSAA